MTVNEYGMPDSERPSEKIERLEKRINELELRIAALENPVPWKEAEPQPLAADEVQCQTCGLIWKGAMGYVCSRTDCPMQATVTSADFPLGLNTGG